MNNFFRRLQKLSNSSAMIAIGRFSSMILSLGTLPIIARELGPDGRGLSAAIVGVVTITPVILGLGVPLAARRQISAGASLADTVRTARLYSWLTMAPALMVAFPLALLIFPDANTPELIAYYIGMAAVPLSVSWATDVSVLVTGSEFRRMALLGLINSGGTFLVIMGVWLMGELSVASVIYASVVSNLVTFITGTIWVRTRGGRVSGFTTLVREGLSLTGGQMAEIASRRLDQIIALPLLGPTAAGLYSIAVTVGALSTPIAQSLAAASFNDSVRGDKAVLRSSVKQAVALSVFSSLGLTVAAWIFIPVVFGEEFRASVPVAFIAILGSAFVFVGFQCSMILTAQQRGVRMTLAQVAGAIVSLGLITPLAGIWGPYGVAVATALGSAVAFLVVLLQTGVGVGALLARPRDLLNGFKTLLRGK